MNHAGPAQPEAQQLGLVEPAGKSSGSTRAIVLGLLLLPVNLLLLVYMEFVNRGDGWANGPFPSQLSLFPNTILFLLLLTLLNKLYARRFPASALRRDELLLIYIMLMISTSIVSQDFLQVLIPMMMHAFAYATPENRWHELILPHMSPYLTVSDPEAVKGWYQGHSSLYQWSILRCWLLPVAVWSSAIMVMLYAMLCINTLVRQQWMQNEKLTFPTVEVPLQLTESGCPLLKSKLMWTGFAISAGITALNGLHLFYPSLPAIQVKFIDYGPMLTSRPWNAIGWTPVSFYPYAIGFAFLLPVDMLFSCWFFVIWWRIVRVAGATCGAYDAMPDFPYTMQQTLGAYYMIALYALWASRAHLARVFRVAFKGEHDPDESQGPMRYRTAYVGLAACVCLLSGFFTLLGLRSWLALLAIGLYFLIALAIARIHAEFGPPSHDIYWVGPDQMLTRALSPAAFGGGELATLNWFWWFNRSYRSIPIAYQLDSLRIGQQVGIPPKRIVQAIALSSFSAIILGFWILIHLGYQRGGAGGLGWPALGFGTEAYTRLEGWMTSNAKPDVSGTGAIGFGMLFTVLLYAMRARLVSFPFHPLGFALSSGWTTQTLWMPIFIAWLCKSITFKCGGLRTYRVVRPFFLGLLLGDFIVGCLWPILGWIFNVPAYSFMQ